MLRLVLVILTLPITGCLAIPENLGAGAGEVGTGLKALAESMKVVDLIGFRTLHDENKALLLKLQALESKLAQNPANNSYDVELTLTCSDQASAGRFNGYVIIDPIWGLDGHPDIAEAKRNGKILCEKIGAQRGESDVQSRGKVSSEFLRPGEHVILAVLEGGNGTARLLVTVKNALAEVVWSPSVAGDSDIWRSRRVFLGVRP